MAYQETFDKINQDLLPFCEAKDVNRFGARLMESDCNDLLRAAISKRLPNKKDKQEIIDNLLQDLLCKVLQALQGGKIQKDPLIYVLWQAKNIVVDDYRKFSRRKKLLSRGNNAAPMPDKYRNDIERGKKTLLDTLDALPPPQRLLFDLCLRHSKALLKNSKLNPACLVEDWNAQTGGQTTADDLRVELESLVYTIRDGLLDRQGIKDKSLYLHTDDFNDPEYLAENLAMIIAAHRGEVLEIILLDPPEEDLPPLTTREKQASEKACEKVWALFTKKNRALLGKPGSASQRQERSP